MSVSLKPVDRSRYNAVKAAVLAGHERLINTGPKPDNMFSYRVTEEMPWHTGIGLYSFTKGVGHEITRVFALNHPIHILTTLHGSFPVNDGSGTACQHSLPGSAYQIDMMLALSD